MLASVSRATDVPALHIGGGSVASRDADMAAVALAYVLLAVVVPVTLGLNNGKSVARVHVEYT